jgi:phosphoribosylamine--glycine ligase
MTLVMPTRLLIVGGGGREHALAWKLAHEPGVNEVIVAPGSDGIGEEPRVRCAPDVDPLDGPALVALARREAAELAVIGPEAPLAAGVADALRAAGVPVFGPSAAAAGIESSKAFCREVAGAAGVPIARGRAFERPGPDAHAYAREIAAGDGSVVVKADGLAGGKGVTVCDDLAAVEAAIQAVDGPFVLEERLTGREASVIALCDGHDALALPISRDHKRLLDGDAGPNTGGMGAYSPLEDLPDEVADGLLDTFHRPVLAELARRGLPFRGALYGGLMLTSDGPRLLEFNARFGDPETQVILPRLAIALGPLLLAAARGDLRRRSLPAATSAAALPVVPRPSVGIVLAAGGYPAAPARGDEITGIGRARETGALVFHAGTRRRAMGDGYETNGGRVLTVVGESREAAERAADLISWPGLQRRHDIALAEPVAAGR